MDSSPAINVFEFEEAAKKLLPKADYDSIATGSTDEITLRRTREVFDSIRLRPRVLVDINQRDLSTKVLGRGIDFPLMISPAGSQGRAHPDGELATARAAGLMGTNMIVSSASSYTLEEVANAATGAIWFQQYLYRDGDLTESFIRRAEEAGYSALCLTLDFAGDAKQERNIRNRYSTPPPSNYPTLTKRETSESFGVKDPRGLHSLIDQTATWSYLDWVSSKTTLPLVAKGIMTAEDALLCVRHDVKAIIVSNHGARQLDTTYTTMEVLPEIIDVVAGKVEVYIDGGIRRGTDIIKALALGAKAVLIGRPLFWGLAVGGEVGVINVLRILRDELDMAMGMCGRPTIDSIDLSLLGKM